MFCPANIIDVGRPKKVLIVKPSSLGDIVHSLPFLDAMHRRFEGARIDWVVAKGFEGLLDAHPMISRLLVINKDRWKRLVHMKETIDEVKGVLTSLRSERYDLAVDLQGLFRSGALTYATHAPFRVGFHEAREGSRFFYTHTVSGGRDVHALDRNLRIAATIGCDTSEVRFPFPELQGSEDVRRLKARLGNYAVLVPGARWVTKRWPANRFGRLATLLDLKSIVVGGHADIPLGQEVEATSVGKAVSVAGLTDLRDLVAIMRDARVVVTNDSGPMHIASAFGVPVIALFGPTNPMRTGPYGDPRRSIIVKAGMACSPCYKKQCNDIRCMEDIPVNAVHEAVLTVINQQ